MINDTSQLVATWLRWDGRFNHYITTNLSRNSFERTSEICQRLGKSWLP